MLDRIEEGFTRLSKFSDDLAHEIRTPISNLMGEAELGLTRPRTNTEYREILQSICEESQHVTKIIETLLFPAFEFWRRHHCIELLVPWMLGFPYGERVEYP